MSKLWPMGKWPKQTLLLVKCICGMLHANKNIEYPKHFYQHELGKALDYKRINRHQNPEQAMVRWIVMEEEQLTTSSTWEM
jgi:hypothetical protein